MSGPFDELKELLLGAMDVSIRDYVNDGPSRFEIEDRLYGEGGRWTSAPTLEEVIHEALSARPTTRCALRHGGCDPEMAPRSAHVFDADLCARHARELMANEQAKP